MRSMVPRSTSPGLRNVAVVDPTPAGVSVEIGSTIATKWNPDYPAKVDQLDFLKTL
jgi:hypothetical protein